MVHLVLKDLTSAGSHICGRITYRSESDIEVEIISPYKGLTRVLHIPYFARSVNSFLTEYGDSTAEYLLKELYQLGQFVEENREFLISQLVIYFRERDYSNHERQNLFFEKCFPFIVPVGTRDKVLELLNGNQTLNSP